MLYAVAGVLLICCILVAATIKLSDAFARKTPAKTATRSPLKGGVGSTPPTGVTLADWRSPIALYGRVVDDNGSPVENADVRLVWTDLSAKGTSEALRQSGMNGSFSLEGVSGRNLTVEISKAGFKFSRKRNRHSFDYASKSDPNFYVPDSKHPVIFQLRKLRPANVVYRPERTVPLPPDSSPVLHNLQGDDFAPGSEDLALVFWRSPHAEPGKPYDWNLTITGVSGTELAEAGDEVMTEAPDEGWVPSLTVSESASMKDWRGGAKIRMYVRKPQAPMYAAVEITVAPGLRLRRPTKEGGVRIVAFINSTGSRILDHEMQP